MKLNDYREKSVLWDGRRKSNYPVANSHQLRDLLWRNFKFDSFLLTEESVSFIRTTNVNRIENDNDT